MYGIKRETIEEMSRYDVLKYYNELKYTIRTDVTRIPVVIDKMYHIIKSCMDFSRHSIVLRNQDLNSSLIKTVNMNVEQVSPQTVIVQKCTDLNQSHASERQIHDDDNIDVASLSIFNVYNVLSPYCVNVSPSYAVKVGESLSYSMPLFGADTHRTFIILPIVVHITDREFYIVNTITFDNGTFFLCRQSIKNEQQIPFNEYVTSSNIIDGIKCNSIAASVNLDGNVVSITPMLTKNAFNQLMLINCATIDGSERYLYS